MAKVRDFRLQSSQPSAPSVDGSPDKIAVYANSSGVLIGVRQNNYSTTVGQQWTGTLAMAGAALFPPTGAGKFFGAGNLNATTGIVIGSTGNSVQTMVLGLPAAFVPIVGPSGEAWVVPAYTFS